MADLKLRSQDYMGITRALDQNKNNRIDPSEATISSRAHREIGNNNGVAGTRETAEALERGDVFISRLEPASADRVSEYFSKRNENFDKPVVEWVSDAWVSREDLDMSADFIQKVDANGDNKISRKEFAQGLVSGTITIGQNSSAGQNPFTQPPASPQPRPPVNNNPHNTNPFNQAPQVNQPHNTNPFNNGGGYNNTQPSNSDAALRMQMISSFSSDSDKTQLLTEIARGNLSTQDQLTLIGHAKNLSYNDNKSKVLEALARNNTLTEEGAAALAGSVSTFSFDDNRKNLLSTMLTNQRLSSYAQRAVVGAISSFSYEDKKVTVLRALIQYQQLDQQTKQQVLQTAQNNLSYDSNKKLIYNELFR